jgi:hypothetical protein
MFRAQNFPPQIVVPCTMEFQLGHPIVLPQTNGSPALAERMKTSYACTVSQIAAPLSTRTVGPDAVHLFTRTVGQIAAPLFTRTVGQIAAPLSTRTVGPDAAPLSTLIPNPPFQNIKQYDPTKARAERMEWSLKLAQIEGLCIPGLSRVNPSIVRPWMSMEYQGDSRSFMTGLQAKYMWYQLQLDAAVGNLTLVTGDKKTDGFWGILEIHATQDQLVRCRRNEVPFIEKNMPKKAAKTLYAIWKRIGFPHSIRRPNSAKGISLAFQANKIVWTKKKSKDDKVSISAAYEVNKAEEADVDDDSSIIG